jgi:hypothetical protein
MNNRGKNTPGIVRLVDKDIRPTSFCMSSCYYTFNSTYYLTGNCSMEIRVRNQES